MQAFPSLMKIQHGPQEDAVTASLPVDFFHGPGPIFNPNQTSRHPHSFFQL